ncbi:hypothetical protein WJX72_000746 [[Myrmecia] bisecta]|uniref:Uncharacterized protein n=1 Tax=[Myrmecia] bisecta TaxID=41462 RepID=A0AAW1QE36_9CHLO
MAQIASGGLGLADALDGIRTSMDGVRAAHAPGNRSNDASNRSSFDQVHAEVPARCGSPFSPTDFYTYRAPEQASYELLRASSSHGNLVVLEEQITTTPAGEEAVHVVRTIYRPDPGSKPQRSESDDGERVVEAVEAVVPAAVNGGRSSVALAKEDIEGYKPTNYYKTASKLLQDAPRMQNSSSLLDLKNTA